jgi:acetyltransferase-like isoleucine patch superfamily enzyme/dTDP-4-dehydrorhamnose 3,5-epimerase-like enzyme
MAGAIIGEDCNICDGVFVESGVRIGNRVTLECGARLCEGVILEDEVRVGPNVTFCNDKFPIGTRSPDGARRSIVRKNATVGANAVILPGVMIGSFATVGAGAVVIRSVPSYAIAVGNPARIVGYVESKSAIPKKDQLASDATREAADTGVRGVRSYEMPLIKDMRGSLTVGEFKRRLPFIPKRYFFVFDVPSREIRGEHAHRACHQFLICARGRLSVVADDGQHRREFALDRPTIGLYLPPMVWAIQYKFSADAILIVFCSDYYDPNDYIRDYAEFLATLKASGGT